MVEKIPSLDAILVGVAVWAFGNVLGPALGVVMLIVFGWFAGVIIGVWRMGEDGTRIKTVWFIVVSFIVTVGGAGVLANIVAPRVHSTPFELLFFVAIAIPAVGTSWLGIFKWAGRIVMRLVESKVKGDAP